MDIKNFIVDKHREAEETVFFKTLIDRKLTGAVWGNFLFNKILILSFIEARMSSINDLDRTKKLICDIVNSGCTNFTVKPTTYEYVNYLKKIDDSLLMAHVYVWYMGDLNGGKMIKKIAPTENTHLDFSDPDTMKKQIMEKVNTNLVEEITISFDWVINLLNEFEEDIQKEMK